MHPAIYKRKLLIIIIIVSIGVSGVLFLVRNPLLRLVANRKISAIEASTGYSIQYKSLGFKGIRNLFVTNLSVSSNDSLRTLHIGNVNVKLSFWDLLRLRANPKSIQIDTLIINVGSVAANSIGKPESLGSTPEHQLKELIQTRKVSRALRGFIGVSTAEIEVKNLLIKFSKDEYTLRIETPIFLSEKGLFKSTLSITENNHSQILSINGNAIKASNYIDFSIKGSVTGKVKLPLIENMYDLKCQFDSLQFTLKGNELYADSVSLTVSSGVFGLEIDHRHLSDKTVIVDNASFKLGIGLSNQFITIDSLSYFNLNAFKLPISIAITNNRKPRTIVKSETQRFLAASLFESLPHGLFNTLQGVRVKGNMEFKLFVDLDLEIPDSLKFDINLLSHNFSIAAFGSENFYALNDTFTYVAYENCIAIREIAIDSTRESFARLHSISPYLMDALVTSEDGGFFFHKGFDFDGIRYAMVQNLTAKRFARGGSTITQQLVKNVYLNRSKNIMRKAEEAIIVWLIETQRLVSKRRILEIYFNLIEWGPNVYGVNEACRFYFDKLPSDLTLNEALFLTSVVPRPKSIHSSVDADGNLTPFLFENHLRIARIMLQRQMISQEEFDILAPKLHLSQAASEYLKRKGNVVEDSDVLLEELGY